MALRSKISFREKVLGCSLSRDHMTMTGCRLPTNRQVLQCILAHLMFEELSPLTASKKVVSQITWFYSKGGVPTIQEHKMVEEVMKLKKKLDNVAKSSVARRDPPPPAVKSFEDDLDKTFKVWPRDAEQRIAHEEDKQFLISMKGDRKASFDGLDKVEEAFQQRKDEREKKAEERREKEKKRKEDDLTVTSDPLPDSIFNNDFEEFDQDNEEPDTPVSHKRQKKTGTTGFFNHDILKSPDVVSTAIRNNITPTALSAITASIIKAAGGDADKVSLNYATAYR